MKEIISRVKDGWLSNLLETLGIQLLRTSNQLKHKEKSFPERTNLIELLLLTRTGQSHEVELIMTAYLKWINSESINFNYETSAIENGHILIQNSVFLSELIRNNPNEPIKADLQVLLSDIFKNCSEHLIIFVDLSETEIQQINTRAREIQQHYLYILDLLPYSRNGFY